MCYIHRLSHVRLINCMYTYPQNQCMTRKPTYLHHQCKTHPSPSHVINEYPCHSITHTNRCLPLFFIYSTTYLLVVCSMYSPIPCVLATSTWVDIHLLFTHTMFPESSVHSAHPVGHTEIIRQLFCCISFYINKKQNQI